MRARGTFVNDLITASNAGARFGGTDVLNSVDLAISAGEIVTIVGPNGSGKSTLLRMLIGAIQPSSGTIRRRTGLRIGYVPQKLALDATLPITVERFLSLPKRSSSKRIERALEEVDMSAHAQAQVASLSGGQIQRVLLARALLSEPDILVLDEPTQGLDQHGISDFYAMIEEVRAALGCAVLMVSHDLHVVMRASDRVICLNGHICCQGAPTDVSASAEYQALFGERDAAALALYRHHHDHAHHHDHPHHHDHNPAELGPSNGQSV